MRSESSTVGIVPGDGLVARFGGVVVFLATANASTDRILGAVRAAADGDRPGPAIAQRLAAVVFGGSAEPPPFGVVAPTPDGTLLLLRGAVSAQLHGAEGLRTLSGERAFTWVDEIVREPVRTVSVGPDDRFPLAVAAHSDLREGVVPGGGFVLRAALRKAGGRKSVARKTPKVTVGEPPATQASGFAAAPEPTGAEPAVSAGPATAAEAAVPGTGLTPAVRSGKGSTRAGASGRSAGAGAPAEASPATGRAATASPATGHAATASPTPGRAAAGTATGHAPTETGHSPAGTSPATGHAPADAAHPTGHALADGGPPTEYSSAAMPPVTGHSPAGEPAARGRAAAAPTPGAGSAPGKPGHNSAFADNAASDPTTKAPPRPDSPRPLAWSQVPEGPHTFAPRTGSAPPASGRMFPPRAGEAPGRDAQGRVALRKAHGSGTKIMPVVPEATVGALVVDGTAYPLDRPYVIGRGPQADAAVKAAVAAPLVLPRDRHVSRVHAYVEIDNGNVFVRDAGTGAGTFVAPPGTDEWARIGTTRTELPPGARVRISDRVLTYLPDQPH